jgi:hypothetical protein
MKELHIAEQQMVQNVIIKKLYKDAKISSEQLEEIEQLLRDFVFAVLNEYMLRNNLIEDESKEEPEFVIELTDDETDNSIQLDKDELRILIKSILQEMVQDTDDEDDDTSEDWKKN